MVLPPDTWEIVVAESRSHSVRGPDGSAPAVLHDVIVHARRTSRAGTFATKTATDSWLAAVETDIARGQWSARSRQLVLSAYADSWLPARADLKIRTRELYRWLLDKYVLPATGKSAARPGHAACRFSAERATGIEPA